MWARLLAVLIVGILLACSGVTGERRAIEPVLPYEIVDHRASEGPPGVPAVEGTRLDAEQVQLRLRSFPWYCAPSPTFDVEDDDGTLRLVALQPSHASRCTGSHDLTIRLPSHAREVEVRLPTGEVVVEGAIR